MTDKEWKKLIREFKVNKTYYKLRLCSYMYLDGLSFGIKDFYSVYSSSTLIKWTNDVFPTLFGLAKRKLF